MSLCVQHAGTETWRVFEMFFGCREREWAGLPLPASGGPLLIGRRSVFPALAASLSADLAGETTVCEVDGAETRPVSKREVFHPVEESSQVYG